jgi:hypothetical protein
MRETLFILVAIITLAGCCNGSNEYTPENTLTMRTDFSKFNSPVFREARSEDYNNSGRLHGNPWRFFVVGEAKNPERIVLMRNDGQFYSAFNPKGLKLETGRYVRLVRKYYWIGNIWETAYLEVDSLE